MRSFLCIELNKQARATCSDIIEQIKNLDLVYGNFVKHENLHLTLKFLGEIETQKLEIIKKALNKIQFKKFEVKLGELGFFPSEKFIRVLWINLISEKIFELKKIIDLILGENYSNENNFKSHVTLARIKKIKDKKLFTEKIKNIEYEKTKFNVNEFVLKQSELTPQGPAYQDLMKIEFK